MKQKTLLIIQFSLKWVTRCSSCIRFFSIFLSCQFAQMSFTESIFCYFICLTNIIEYIYFPLKKSMTIWIIIFNQYRKLFTYTSIVRVHLVPTFWKGKRRSQKYLEMVGYTLSSWLLEQMRGMVYHISIFIFIH